MKKELDMKERREAEIKRNRVFGKRVRKKSTWEEKME